MVKDPQFKDTANNDYQLIDNSPCRNAADDGYNMGAYLGSLIIGIMSNPAHNKPCFFSLKSNAYTPAFIQFSIPTQQAFKHVSVSLYTGHGKCVRILVNEPKKAGLYTISWNGCYESAEKAGAGVYFCILRVGDVAETKSFIFLQ